MDAEQIKAGAHKCFQSYSSTDRANRQASHRLGHRQRQAIGEHYWTHDLVPGIAFPTRKAAIRAAISKSSEEGGLRIVREALESIPPDYLLPGSIAALTALEEQFRGLAEALKDLMDTIERADPGVYDLTIQRAAIAKAKLN